MSETVVDWSSRPEPWRWIGPQFRAECEGIVEGMSRQQEPRHIERGSEIRRRRLALGLTCETLGVAAGYCNHASASSQVSKVEAGNRSGIARRRIEAALDRAEQGDR